MPVGPTDWAQFYHHTLSPPHQPIADIFAGGGRVSDATVVTTTNVTSSAAALPQSLSGQGGSRLSPEGRVSKPVRRRTRASRRTPTTVLNTDASNFRAMVQQFTGGPSLAAAQPMGHYPFLNHGSGYGFGLGSSVVSRHTQLGNPTPARTTSGYQFPFQTSQSGGPFMFPASQPMGISNSDDHAGTSPGSLSFLESIQIGSTSTSFSAGGNETNNFLF
ncbi:unnamed protein product [Cuscuta campestris]|uniref:VQ domain-containing protein n=1 Tax=Cuscuta campestris TaxID=132261 RepID=A0A484MXF1_9ASTE|nr:unnamed protein product [Cuscuta campestris]